MHYISRDLIKNTSSTGEQYKMEDDIDIEEHDLLDDPALRSVFPDLVILKREIIDFDVSEGHGAIEIWPSLSALFSL
ncbi:uncharacterized protein LOC105389491 isoform X4 [Plutella xylostella]|uniref:uncharacterized protein LOC119693290 isoform X4 n=1 Tax=Plutella xylostella TaxID=51655 RepID=UPI0020322F2C|nr:uncharacterized protein LOC119693290 isoform X4 [Plutella xylostella]XP_048479932.1 uncharacterized protein LOC105389491 isoform X4 [Plutella xylostella]